MEDEDDIISRIVSGDRERFRLLVERYEGRVFSLILRQVRDNSIARDLTQESFLRAYLHLKQFRRESRFSTWITRIAINLVHNYFSSKAYRERRAAISFSLLEHDRVASENLDFTSNGMASLVVALIGDLRPRYREVFVLCTLEQKTYEEAAEILKIPYGTVCSRMGKAYEELRRQIFNMKGRAYG